MRVEVLNTNIGCTNSEIEKMKYAFKSMTKFRIVNLNDNFLPGIEPSLAE